MITCLSRIWGFGLKAWVERDVKKERKQNQQNEKAFLCVVSPSPKASLLLFEPDKQVIGSVFYSRSFSTTAQPGTRELLCGIPETGGVRTDLRMALSVH